MAPKYLIRLAALAATLLAAGACIYPYRVDITSGGEYPLVIDGDLLIGSSTTLSFSHVLPFDQSEKEETPVLAKGYIEGEDGIRVDGRDPYYRAASDKLDFDTSALPENQRYRIHIETLNPEDGSSTVFESDWLTPAPAPAIDALTYSQNKEFNELWIGLSMHCHGSHYFRWSFTEEWEYHSDISTDLTYTPRVWDEQAGELVGGYGRLSPTLYYCWNKYSSPQINIFSTANQTEDRFEELSFHTIPLDDKRLQVLYRITVRLQALSENAYNYWNNIQQNSEGQGSIFAPTPSEMASNVHCISDPSIPVMGYLNAAVPAEAVMYYDNTLERFYQPHLPFERIDTTIRAGDYTVAESLFRQKFLPYAEVYNAPTPEPSDYTWTPDICIDCRRQGGTKNRPDSWPNNHQ